MEKLVKISGLAGDLAAPEGVHMDGLTLKDNAGAAYYQADGQLLAALSGGPVTLANGKVRVSIASGVDITRLQPSGPDAQIWLAKLMTAGLAVRAPSLPASWAQAIVAAA